MRDRARHGRPCAHVIKGSLELLLGQSYPVHQFGFSPRFCGHGIRDRTRLTEGAGAPFGSLNAT
jgi:hypothetical protein